MIFLIKKFVFAVFLICGIFTVCVSADSNISLNAGSEFYVYGEESAKAAETLGMSEKELSYYCKENSIEYLAVNKDNSKQIRLTVGHNDFTNSVVNISGLSNDKITSILPQIIGIEGIKGEIINKNGQKFIKTELRTSDSGGEYILTEYITVADKQSYVLSFYTDIDANNDYADIIFQTYNSSVFIDEQKQSGGVWQYILPAATVIFAAISVSIAITLIIDIRKKRVENMLKETEEN